MRFDQTSLLRLPAIALVTILCGLLAPSAAHAVTINGVDWGDNVYDPGTGAGKHGLPTAATPAWTRPSPSMPHDSVVEGDVLRITTGSTAEPEKGRCVYQQATDLGAGVTAATIEVRVGNLVATKDATYTTQILWSNATGEFSIGPAGVRLRLFSPTAAATKAGDFTGMHTYRILIAPTSATQYRVSVYMDGQYATPLLSLDREGTASIPNFQFGDGSNTAGAVNGVAEYDYVAWKAAAVPIPEPASLAMLGLAMYPILRHRGR